MAITRWAPLNALASFEREMQDIMDRMAAPRWFERFEWMPSTDMYREKDAVVVRAELPGIAADEIDVEIEGNVLHIKGEKREEKEVDEADRYLKECHYGSFERTVMLPDGVDIDTVSAKYDNGILCVRIPMPDEQKPTSHKVEVER